MKLYIFKGNRGKKDYVAMNERDAHNYLRNRSNWERQDLVYKGAIDEALVIKKNNEIYRKVREKYGVLNILDDEIVMESRQYADELLGDELEKIYQKADKKKIPRNFDILGEDGNINTNTGVFGRMIGK